MYLFKGQMKFLSQIESPIVRYVQQNLLPQVLFSHKCCHATFKNVFIVTIEKREKCWWVFFFVLDLSCMNERYILFKEELATLNKPSKGNSVLLVNVGPDKFWTKFGGLSRVCPCPGIVHYMSNCWPNYVFISFLSMFCPLNQTYVQYLSKQWTQTFQKTAGQTLDKYCTNIFSHLPPGHPACGQRMVKLWT